MTIKEIGKEMTWAIRHQVLWPDNHIDDVKLAEDDAGVHYGLFVGERLVSIVSLFQEQDEAQFRKFATLEQEQGKGYGSRLLSHMFSELERREVRRVWCNARQDKAAFYRKFGMHETSRAFQKDGVAFVIMEKDL